MSNVIKELGEHGTELPNADARIFLEFKYPEIRDLLKHFLTLISASLVFSVTFSEKIVNFEVASALQKGLLLGSYFYLILAMVCCVLVFY